MTIFAHGIPTSLDFERETRKWGNHFSSTINFGDRAWDGGSFCIEHNLAPGILSQRRSV
ncbi:hypothetical protein HCG48_24920 [Oxynema aestuarii AP17]|uniref:Uncharacterized protein n=1 Tax=Oxynema aestuarii AP17 TaxID=2064643 RepID=A0A6H1U3J7_9CYAN|nr:hypothetical protein HCG48_24920 [Oxynema aestuarii AP17]